MHILRLQGTLQGTLHVLDSSAFGTAGGGLRRPRRASKRLRRLSGCAGAASATCSSPPLRGDAVVDLQHVRQRHPPAWWLQAQVASRDCSASVWSEARPYGRRRPPSCPGRALGSAGAVGAPGASRQRRRPPAPGRWEKAGGGDELPFSTAPPAEEEELHVALEELGAARGELRVPLVPRVPDAEERDRLAEEEGVGRGVEAWRERQWPWLELRCRAPRQQPGRLCASCARSRQSPASSARACLRPGRRSCPWWCRRASADSACTRSGRRSCPWPRSHCTCPHRSKAPGCR